MYMNMKLLEEMDKQTAYFSGIRGDRRHTPK
jgi:hypothetical protein